MVTLLPISEFINLAINFSIYQQTKFVCWQIEKLVKITALKTNVFMFLYKYTYKNIAYNLKLIFKNKK